jgi:hypothetical protein
MGIFALMISVAFVSGVMAQQKPASTPAATTQESKLEKFSGVIENVDMTKKDVLVEMHKEKMTFSVGDHTKIYEGKKVCIPCAEKHGFGNGLSSAPSLS